MFFYKRTHIPCQIKFSTFAELFQISTLKLFDCYFQIKNQTENTLILKPKSYSNFVYNSFIPYIRIENKNDYLEIEYFLKKTILVPFQIIIGIFLSFGFLTPFIESIGNDKYVFFCLSVGISIFTEIIAAVIFYFSIAQIEKKLVKIVFENQSGDG